MRRPGEGDLGVNASEVLVTGGDGLARTAGHGASARGLLVALPLVLLVLVGSYPRGTKAEGLSGQALGRAGDDVVVLGILFGGARGRGQPPSGSRLRAAAFGRFKEGMLRALLVAVNVVRVGPTVKARAPIAL